MTHSQYICISKFHRATTEQIQQLAKKIPRALQLLCCFCGAKWSHAFKFCECGFKYNDQIWQLVVQFLLLHPKTAPKTISKGLKSKFRMSPRDTHPLRVRFACFTRSVTSTLEPPFENPRSATEVLIQPQCWDNFFNTKEYREANKKVLALQQVELIF